METRDRIQALLYELGKGAFEREEAIGLALLSAISGESIFLLGLPGVGKSMIARRLKQAFTGSRSFEYLMSRFSTPDEIFGPVSISKLKDHDRYERVVDGYLPTADIIFLDEIWKSGPAILNSLLTVLNEKIYRNGKEDILLPLKVIISASNELPAEGEGLEALWDRFLIRYIVKPIKDKELFLDLLCSQPEDCVISEQLKITPVEFGRMKKESAFVAVPEEIAEIIFSIRKTLDEQKKEVSGQVDVTKTDLIEPPYVSDRRWKKIVGIMKTSAYLNGRGQVDYSDCLLMDHMLWDKDEQISSVSRLVTEAIVNSLHHAGMPNVVEGIQGRNYTKPVGKPISPDGIHYIFNVGGEDIRIAIKDYESLSMTNKSFGIMSNDGHLLLSVNPTSLTIKKTSNGLSINAFSYSLKRDSSLKSGSVKDMINDMTKDVDKMKDCLDDIVCNNLFVPSGRLRQIKKQFENIKGKIIRKGF